MDSNHLIPVKTFTFPVLQDVLGQETGPAPEFGMARREEGRLFVKRKPPDSPGGSVIALAIISQNANKKPPNVIECKNAVASCLITYYI